MIKAVVLDGHTLNPGDLSWQALEECADLTIYGKTDKEQMYDRLKDCEAVFSNKAVFSKELITRLPKLRYIGVLATGYNVIDTEAARSAGITVTNIPAYSSDSVAQLVFAFIFEFSRHVKEHSDEVHAGKWTESQYFCYHSFPMFELTGKTMGIVGMGSIGQKVAAIALSMGMEVLYVNRSVKDLPHLAQARKVGFDELLEKADIISLHVPLNAETTGLINQAALERVKSGCLIINTGRGRLIDEDAVAAALKNGTIAGYAADVLRTEPPRKDNPLLGCPNCLITPHIAWQSIEARTRLLHTAVHNFKQFLQGNPCNTVS